ncbi:PAS domain-containing sensor histidine kinase [Fodinibius halophilus]|uniref:PAS domain S-box protein n=1 Tax=Fodinibius halophilus TaxID=1736908 RepID=A0A6M1TIK4_9BACT|nr:PAS domain S-box protein [Fodinibius halophilus]NGP89882.1 PAS domain S-box protein [Fodinibius halophilus]
MLKSIKSFESTHLLFTGIAALCFFVFVVDIQFPLGIAGGVPYALLVMATYWNKTKQPTLITGIVSTLLIIIGFFGSESSEYIIMAGANRGMAIVVVWGAVWFVNKYRESIAKIQKDEKRISALFEAATEGMLISDMKGNIVMLNEKIEELFGYSREELIGEEIEKLVPGRFEEKHPEHRHQYYENPEPRPMGQGRDLYGLKKNGEEFPVEISLNHFETAEGKFIISYIIDITQRKKAEQQMRENERRYSMLFQALTDEILVFQLDEQMQPLPFTEVNNVACEILGYEREELLQKTIYDIVNATEKEVDDRIQHILEHREVLWETEHVTSSGKAIPLEIRAKAFIYSGTNTIIVVGRDVRELRKLEKEILNISEQERRRIGQDMHDGLGQMLTGIGLIAQNLAKKLESNELPGAETAQEISDMIRKADDQAHSLARGLVPVDVEANGLGVAIQELVERIQKLYDVKINYNSNNTGSSPFVQDNDTAIHLYRITQEALNNAVKHAGASTITVGLQSSESYLQIRIQDDGEGFDEITDMTKGMGMRLMNFRAQMIGGNLEVNSKEGEGTKIICEILNESSSTAPEN